MKTYIGIDLGTSGVKLLLLNEDGKILNIVTKDYPIFYRQKNHSSQNPEDWFCQTIEGLKELLINQNTDDVCAISFGGQMHGLVILDKDDNVIRPAILWNDGRSTLETEYLNNNIGKNNIAKYTGNIAYPGFTAPKILWIYNNEKENFDKINKIMLPKDYLIYRLSGVFATDVSDASGLLLLDVKNRKYSQEMLDICHINQSMLPKLYESFECVGTIKKEIADELKLKSSVKIVAGAGDNAAAAIGTNTIKDGSANISLGTSGTIFIPSSKFIMDKNNSLHSFCDASNKYHLMGCILSAASCRKWWIEEILKTNDYIEDENLLCDSDIIFLPYLVGERSPHNDVNIRGSFMNLSMNSTRGQMSKAIMEGVIFAIKDCLEIANENGICPQEATICGGGAKSEKWKQMAADILNIPIKVLKTEQGPSFGAAILAMVGDGLYKDVSSAANDIVEVERIIYPDINKQKYYQEKYHKFHSLYPLIKNW